MTPQAREIIREVSHRRGVDPKLVASKCRVRWVYWARVEVAKRLDARGYSTPRIGKILGHDHTTIVYYLGRGKKRPGPEPARHWRTPRIRLLKWIVKPRPTPRTRNDRLYLVPYAGADMTDYHWKERSDVRATTEAHSR